MKAETVEIVWHGKEPVFSVDVDPRSGRVATGGADNDVRLWRLAREDEAGPPFVFLASLSRHSKAVNVVRFSPCGSLLASAGDDGAVVVWRRDDPAAPAAAEDPAESWSAQLVLRPHLEDIYDLAWSPDSARILTGSVDNTAVIWDRAGGQRVAVLRDHGHYVQGVAWDPLGKYVATQSCDRTVRVYALSPARPPSRKAAPAACAPVPRLLGVVSRMDLAAASIAASAGPCRMDLEEPQAPASRKHAAAAPRLYEDETLPSFFRRLCFSPDGSLLITPSAIERTAAGGEDSRARHLALIFSRGTLARPVLAAPCGRRPCVAVRFCPILWALRGAEPPVVPAPYRMIYALATLDGVVIGDTEADEPMAVVTGLHYAAVTDIAWTRDGHCVIVSSQDGYCSVITLTDAELGSPLPLSEYPPQLAQATVPVDVGDASQAVEQPGTALRPDSPYATSGQAPEQPMCVSPQGNDAPVATTPSPRGINDLSHLIKRKRGAEAAHPAPGHSMGLPAGSLMQSPVAAPSPRGVQASLPHDVESGRGDADAGGASASTSWRPLLADDAPGDGGDKRLRRVVPTLVAPLRPLQP